MNGNGKNTFVGAKTHPTGSYSPTGFNNMNVPDDLQQNIRALQPKEVLRVLPTEPGMNARRAVMRSLVRYMATLRGEFKVRWIIDRIHVERIE